MPDRRPAAPFGLTAALRREVLEARATDEVAARLGVREERVREVRAQLAAEGRRLASPHGLVQERVPRDGLYPWRVLVLCCLLNRTQRERVRAVTGEVFRRWPTPGAMYTAGPELERFMRPLGLGPRKARLLRALSLDVLGGTPHAECAGTGQYALDSLAVFVEGRTDVEPRDGALSAYVGWARAGRPA
jgi:hypothetical protein